MRRRVPAQREYRQLAEVWYMSAHEALWRNAAAERAAGIDWETDEYRELNHDAWLSVCCVRWWREPALNRRVARELRKEGIEV